MAQSDEEIVTFASLVYRLIDKYKSMQAELQELRMRLARQENEAGELRLLAQASQRDYQSLKTAKMLEVGDGDLDAARKRVNKLLHDVNKCITMLTEQQEAS